MAPNIAPTLFLVLIFLSCRCSTGARDANSRLPVKTIKTAGGDVFDCVDIHKQPAFDHPSLKDHQILMKPAGAFFDDFAIGGPKTNDSFNVELENLEECPVGTVPVQRLSKTNLTGYDANHHVLRNDPHVLQFRATREARRNHYLGASSRINACAVHPLHPDQESGALIGLRNDDAESFARGEIRAGWKAAFGIFGNYMTRLFVEWSPNGERTSCFNLICPGFIQTNHKIKLGGAVWPLSTYKGTQYYLHLHMFKDGKNNWWVSMSDVKNVIGYWPSELFTNFRYATTAYFGGLASCNTKQCPPMGNGHYPDNLDPETDPACSMQQVQVMGPDSKWREVGYSQQVGSTGRDQCYRLGPYVRDVRAYKFTFGGPSCEL